LGVDILITHPFTPEVAAITAEDFMQMLSDRLGLRHLLVGHDFALGRGRSGDVNVLRALGERLGYSVDIVEPVSLGDRIISSSGVRAALLEGDVPLAGELLGRPYRLAGEVVHGDARGRELGFPTANLRIPADRLIPRTGVYACRADGIAGGWPAVTNIGYRPTFENEPALPQVETHLLDFDRDLYGQEIRLDFIARLRDEQRFPNVQALIEQVHQDMEKARQLLTAGPGVVPQAKLPE
jgi:riboflavin kinase/FMN adenylyltransferase